MMRKFAIFMLAFVILFAAVGAATSPAAAASCTQYYTVKAGDSLNKIAKKYDTSWQYLAKINQLPNPNKIYPGQVLCVSTTTNENQPPPPASGTIPTISITSVSKNNTVTVTTHNFPANDKFDVLMGKYGSQGIGGIDSGNYASGNGSNKTVTYNIPGSLHGAARIAIRFQSKTGSGFFAYNWFYNNTTGGSSGGGSSGGYTGYPYFFITAVQRDNTVSIKGYNYPPNTKFSVYMGPYGTQAIGGYYVTAFNSGDGGTLTGTFAIPPALYGSKKIAIRTQSNVFFAYNWFFNNNAP